MQTESLIAVDFCIITDFYAYFIYVSSSETLIGWNKSTIAIVVDIQDSRSSFSHTLHNWNRNLDIVTKYAFLITSDNSWIWYTEMK